jgi:hypothetical protein
MCGSDHLLLSGSFENHTGFGIALGQLHKELRCGAHDASAFENAACGVLEDAINAVSLVEVDSDRNRMVVGLRWFGHKTTHPTTSILWASRVRFARESRWDQAFMSADPFYALQKLKITAERGCKRLSCHLTL